MYHMYVMLIILLKIAETIPKLMDAAVDKTEAKMQATIARKYSFGWSIILGSWTDVFSTYFGDSRYVIHANF